MSLQSYDDVNDIREHHIFKVMRLFWCCHGVRTPARGWQLRRQGLLCLDFPWFLSFKILQKFLESGISFHQTTSDLPLFRRRAQWVARCPPCTAHQTVFLNHCLIFYFSKMASQTAASKLRIDVKENPLGIGHLNQSLECLRLLRSVSWCSHVYRGARGKFRLYKSRYWYERSKHGPDGGKT